MTDSTDLERLAVEYWRDDGNPLPGDKEGLELASLRAEVVRLKAERECILATRKFWPFSVREAIRMLDLKACAEIAEQRDQFVADIQTARDRARNEAERARETLAYEHSLCADTMDEAINLETEACAKVAEGFDVRVIDPLGRVHRSTTGLEAIAAAIRARKTEGEK